VKTENKSKSNKGKKPASKSFEQKPEEKRETPHARTSADNNELFHKLVEIFDRELSNDIGENINPADTELKSGLNPDNLLEANELLQSYIQKINRGIDITVENKTGPINDFAESGFTARGVKSEPLVLRPENKLEGIFNDENLTEDYELGLRFYQLGLKTGFFNVKLDGDRNSTRIATAEFFPNKFWPAVKQRSRWIAGICLQNWKAHKWRGNLVTKYFLFRDRKPLISFWSTFLSYVVLLFFVYLGAGAAFGFDESLLNGKISPVLVWLMMFNLLFMVSKGFHRFIFTYGWYGFRYALASIFRLGIDSVINFFAIIRSVSVFRKTKSKVVWDATTHY